MREYSPKRRTALVLVGSGTSGAYHAGVLRALDESGVKIDLVVGSGIGTLGAAYAAVAGGAKLYGEGGFWDGVSSASFYRVRPALRTALLFLAISFGFFLLPVVLALVAGILFPLVLIIDLILPGQPVQFLEGLRAAPSVLRAPYLAALAAPVFVLSVLSVVFLVRTALRYRRRIAEAFEFLLDAQRGLERLRRGLWEIARGAALSSRPASETELGNRYVALAAENLGQPGFRELILRTADLDTGTMLAFFVLGDPHRAAFTAARGRSTRSREGVPSAVDLRADGYDVLFFDAVASGLLPPLATPVRRVPFPRGGIYAGETHRLSDSTLIAGCGISEALAAGAEQVIVVSAAPTSARQPSRRRGMRAVADGIMAALERRCVDEDVASAERINRMVETLGHRTEDGSRAWQDPESGRTLRSFALYVIRPERRTLGPLELDGALDPATEVLETPADLLDQGYRDAHRSFVEPVVGAAPEPRRATPVAREEGAPVEL